MIGNRTHVYRKYCLKCYKPFRPNGKSTKHCNDCKKVTIALGNIKRNKSDIARGFVMNSERRKRHKKNFDEYKKELKKQDERKKEWRNKL